MDDNNLRPPFFGPALPTYPPVAQLVRVYSSAKPGTNIYPAYIQQVTPALAMRDRTPCYIQEPNGTGLFPGYYDSRLVGSYLGQPLFATTCCIVGSSSSVVPSSLAPSLSSVAPSSLTPSETPSASPSATPSATPSSSSSPDTSNNIATEDLTDIATEDLNDLRIE